jgi:hypothetical protein
MSVKVIVPNKKYKAFEYGVEFYDGEAIFEDEEKGRMIAATFGYEVIEIGAEPAPTKTSKKTSVTKKAGA